MKNLIKLIIISLFILPLQANDSIYSKIKQYHINSFKPKITKENLVDCLDISTGKVDKEKLQQIIYKKYTEPRKYTEIILNLFDLSEQASKEVTTKTSNKLFENLEILCGEHTASSHLLAKIDRTRSFAGRISLAKMLIEPTHNIEELNRRQKIIRELVSDEKTFCNLQNILEKYSLLEKDLLNFFEERSFNKLFGSENYFPNAIWSISFLLDILPQKTVDELKIYELADKINKNNLMVSVLNLYGLISKTYATYTHITEGLYNHTKLAINKFKKNKTKSSILLPFQIIFGFDIGQYHMGRTLGDIRNIYSTIKQEKKNFQILKKAFEKLKKVTSIIENLKEINAVINDNKNLKESISCLSNIEYLFKNKPSKSKFFDLVLKNLDSDTFKKENAPYLHLFLLRGKVLSTAYLLARTQIHLIDFMKSIGQVDAYISIAKLYKESLNKKAKYCFSEYSNKEKAYINFQDFWTPFINPNEVITNNIELGGKNITKCGLISGPNAGGKSTILKSIILNCLLSQTITIAPSSKCLLTPFSYIDSYLNITDDISGGNSLFKSEVLRVKDMINKIKNNGKSIIIVDEMFNGTNPKEGAASSYSIGEYIGKLAANEEKIITLIASHYPEMTELEENTCGIFKNYKVTVNIDKNNHKLNYPFKLQEGKGDQNIAIDILQSVGLDQEIINCARKVTSRNDML
ncbi:hypothetical protein GF385_01130 [Candidatus Dependentiae bacterium]|nr:hypothetical protein [Candidatus Dependentiae bacterium]